METTQKQQLVEEVSKALKEQLQIVADRITGQALRACEEMPGLRSAGAGHRDQGASGAPRIHPRQGSGGAR